MYNERPRGPCSSAFQLIFSAARRLSTKSRDAEILVIGFEEQWYLQYLELKFVSRFLMQFKMKPEFAMVATLQFHFLHCKHYLLDLNNLSNWLWVIRLLVISIVHSWGLLWKAAIRLVTVMENWHIFWISAPHDWKQKKMKDYKLIPAVKNVAFIR